MCSPVSEPFLVDARLVRPTAPDDEDGLLRLWRETWTSTYGPSLGTESLRTMLQSLGGGVAAMLPGRDERGYVIVRGQRIIGSAIAAERGEVAYLWGMYVLPEHQRSGAGSRLLAAVVRDLHVSTALEARVLTTSGEAQAFYRALGFRPIRREETDVMGSVEASTLVLRAEVARLRMALR